MKLSSYSNDNVSEWIEKQIKSVIKKIENNDADSSLLSDLDKYISMKKKYESSIDYFGETIRVMEEFALFTIKHYPKKNTIIQEVVEHFLSIK